MQPFNPSTITVFSKNIKGCKDIFYLVKTRASQINFKWKDEGFNINAETDATFHTKLQKNQNIIGCNS